jgi:hypothetical protein
MKISGLKSLKTENHKMNEYKIKMHDERGVSSDYRRVAERKQRTKRDNPSSS